MCLSFETFFTIAPSPSIDHGLLGSLRETRYHNRRCRIAGLAAATALKHASHKVTVILVPAVISIATERRETCQILESSKLLQEACSPDLQEFGRDGGARRRRGGQNRGVI